MSRKRPSFENRDSSSSAFAKASKPMFGNERDQRAGHRSSTQGNLQDGKRPKKQQYNQSESSYSGSTSSSRDHAHGDEGEMTRSSFEHDHESGSGSGSGSRGRSTDPTSPDDSPDFDVKEDGIMGSDGIPPSSSIFSTSALPFGPCSQSSPDSAPTSGTSRTTYVNPSPTAISNSYPFVSTSFSAASSSASYSTNVEQSYLASSGVLKLNTHPNPPAHTLVTFGAGINSKQLDAATAASRFGAFHVPTSAYPVGSGQFLLGGFGFIGRKHGLAMDCLVEAELVLADGRIVWLGEGGKSGGEWKEGEKPEEVWWGLRGAGPILGVVTRYRARAFYLPSVYAGNLIL